MLDWFRKLMPKEECFFPLFEQHARLLVNGAEILQRLLEGGDPVPGHCRHISQLEEEADIVTRNTLLAVRRTFITPFDRSDIQTLATALDNTIDQMHKTARAALLFDVRAFEPPMREIGRLIHETALVNADAVPLLRDLTKNGARLTQLAESVVQLEGQAEDAHNTGLRQAFQACQHEPLTFYARAEIYAHLKKVMNRFEDVADQLSSILVEHV